MNGETLLGPVGVGIMIAYLVVLIGLGAAGRFARKENSLSDFYLGGRGMGFVVLLLTLYATQYSGNTLVGFSASAYRTGFQFLVSVTFMMGIVGIYLVYAPRLHWLSRRRDYLTLSDFIQDRFGSRLFSALVSLSGIVAMANFILTNLKAIGLTAELATGGTITATQGILGLALVIVVYETLGGLRSVAWTDVLQGIILLLGCVVIFYTVLDDHGGLQEVAHTLKQVRPDFWTPPSRDDCFLWLSTLAVVGLGIAIYPHAIQRIYAARDARTLRRAFQVMVFLPLCTTLFMVLVGVTGHLHFPGLDKQESEGITLRVLTQLAGHASWVAWVIILFLCAVFAAIMSTIDSALLAISSMVTQDLYRPLRPQASQSHLTRVGKVASWLIMAAMAAMAIYSPQTIWRLIEIKLELLMQIAPALILGLHWRGLRAQPVIAGFIVGTVVTLIFTAGNAIYPAIPIKPWGIHAGLLGLIVNLGILLIGMLRNPSRKVGPSGH